jgi:hypothetical protein
MSKEIKKDKKEAKNKKKVGEFNIIIWEGIGMPRQVAQFEANRFLDDDKVPFIVNEKMKFAELYPQDIKQTYKHDKVKIQKEIDLLQKELEKLKSKDIKDIDDLDLNPNDIERDLTLLRAKLRGCKFDGSSDYACSVKGITTFNFKREGNTFFPLKWDLVSDHIFVPSHPVIKKAGILLRNKENKYLDKKLIETTTLILLIVGVVLVSIGLLGNIYMWKSYDDSSIAELERGSIQAQQYCTDSIITQSEILNKMLNQTSQQLDKSSTPNINGIIPS